ncbi:tRNA modification GTPase [Lachnellula arida]|uniref:tRNA modification GTPase n=1 Tax=Lachnellula arida TaxID=1316785 RepID=A0A8T9BFJ8_9HELO|nr:tRNA modification GTPase [Lachnellula arida]
MIRNGLPRAILYPPYVCLRRGHVCREFSKSSALNWPQQWHKKPALQPTTACLPSPRTYYYDSAKSTLEFEPDTVYALSTAPGRAGIAIIRISGPSCLKIYKTLCPSKPPPKPRHATLRTLYDPFISASVSNILDSDALVLYFPAPNTVTGEDVLELHIHGGPATVKAVLSAIPRCASSATIRYAEPGEFTRRAFQNNRLDLAQVEALSDTLSAETEQQRRAAVRGNSGNLGRTYETWRQQLLYARGEMEALIDFSEDQHFDESPAELLANVTAQVDVMLDSIASHVSASHRGELLKRGIRISLLGPPNAGKSSLLNQIVGREASIVSQEAGTTRDIVEVNLDIRGYLCTFADTAGLRTASTTPSAQEANPGIGAIEQEGIRRAKAKASESDVIVALASIESSSSPQGWEIRYDAETLSIAAKAQQALIVVNKCDTVSSETLSDLLSSFRLAASAHFSGNAIPLISVSCRDAQTRPKTRDPGSIDQFTSQLVALFKDMTNLPPDLEDLLGVTERQRQLLSTCASHLGDFTSEASISSDNECDIVLAAEHLRSAADCLSRITGKGTAGDVEEVLGVVFQKFCVGK